MLADGEKTAEYLDSIQNEEWDQQVYQTGSHWRVKSVLAHFVSAEKGFAEVVQNILEGGPGAPRDLDIVEFNEREVASYAAMSPATLIEQFKEQRARTIRLTEQMTPDDLDREGFHPWFGTVDLRNMLKLVYRHNMIHLRDVRKALRTQHPVPHLEVSPPSREEK